MTETTKRPLKVFLCHASLDKPAVRVLYKRLSADGVDAWLDEEKLLPGQNWRQEIPKAVRDADAVIICLSKHSITKEGYIQKEISFALDIAQEKPEGTIYIIPAKLEECEVPSRLGDLQWVDLSFDHNRLDELAYNRLLRSLEQRALRIGVLPLTSNKKGLFDKLLFRKLVENFPQATAKDKKLISDSLEIEHRRYATDPKTFHALLALAIETDPVKISYAITRAIAQTILADLCFLLELSKDNSMLIIAGGYDLIREENLEAGAVKMNMVPMLANSLQRGRPLRLPSSSTSADIRGLAQILGLSNPGHVLNVPIETPEDIVLGSILLLSPYSNRLWSAEDQAFVASFTTSLVPIILRKSGKEGS